MQVLKKFIEYNNRRWFNPAHSKRGSFIAVATGIGTAVAGVSAAAGTAAATTAAFTITAGEVAMGAAAVAGGVAAYGSYQQGQAQKNMMNYQAQAAAVQQGIVQQTAQANITGEENQAALQSKQLANTQAVVKGAQEASMGAAGTDSSVTGADIAKDTFTKQQMDQSTLMYNANVKAWDITNSSNAQLWGLGAQETQYSEGAENAAKAGDISAAGSLLSSASQVGTIGVMNQGFNPGYMG